MLNSTSNIPTKVELFLAVTFGQFGFKESQLRIRDSFYFITLRERRYVRMHKSMYAEI